MVELQDLVRRSKAPDILLVLRDGERHIREIQQLVGGSASTIDSRVTELVAEGLVEEREEHEWPFRRLLKLTENGAEAASAIWDLGLYERPHGRRDVDELEDRERTLLAIIHGVGGSVQGSTRLQKLVFLLTKKLETGHEAPYNFMPYHYGPFDAQVLNDAAVLKDEGALEFRVQTFSPRRTSEEQPEADVFVRKDYHLTELGQEVGRRAFESLDAQSQRTIRALQPFNEMKLKKLLDYVYSEYPEESNADKNEP